MKKRFVKIISGFLAVILFSASMLGCSNDGGETDGGEGVTQSDLMLGIYPQMIAERLPDPEYYEALRMIAAAMTAKTLSAKENSAVSPVATAFSMSLVANALTDKNQTELLHALGDFKMTALNEYNATYAHIIKQDADASVYSSFRLNLGKGGFVPEKTFLQLNADYYGADGYRLNFSEVNVSALLAEWVTAKLGIQGYAVDTKCSADTVSLVADTLSFTDSFEKGFSGKETGVFTAPGGEKEVSYLLANETLYALTSKSKGFAKVMKNGCTFTALLPQGSATLDQLLQSLDSETLTACFEGLSEKETFGVKIPEFSFNFTADAAPALKTLGIKAVFEMKTTPESEKAEFTVEKLLNIASVKLTENGFTTSSALPVNAEIKEAPVTAENVTVFDKPFVFIIFDTEGVPLTLGTVVNP